MTRALIVVDVQNDFCEGGSLPVAGGAKAAEHIAELVRAQVGEQADYGHVIATKDHHIAPGDHFGTPPDYADSWPPHCVVGSAGEAFHPEVDAVVRDGMVDEVFFKGEYRAAYSGFEGRSADGAMLGAWLQANGVTEVDVCGLATDYCVRATALDACRGGYLTRVLTEYSAGVAPDTTASALTELADAGVAVL